jgi:hypothetical protein
MGCEKECVCRCVGGVESMLTKSSKCREQAGPVTSERLCYCRAVGERERYWIAYASCMLCPSSL